MVKFTMKAFITEIIIIASIYISLCGASHETEKQVHFVGDFLISNEPFDYELFIKHDFTELNVSSEFTKILESSRSLGFEFAKEWQNLVESPEHRAVDTTCLQQLGALVAGLAAGDLTSYKYLDSWGKIPAGLLKGHYKEYGNFDECVDLKRAFANHTEIKGKYCLAKLPIGSLFTPSPIGQLVTVQLGVCMPASCSAKEFDVFYKLFMQMLLGLKFGAQTAIVSESSCSLREKAPLKGWDWVAVAVLSILTFGMVFSSLYDYFTKMAGKKPNPILSSFAVLPNMKQLLLVQPNVKSPNVIPCLNGIRCLSLVWIFLGHVFGIFLNLPHINFIDFLGWGKTEFAQIIQGAVFAVDTFFFLSGFLVAFIVLKDMDRNNGKLNVGMMYVHRIIRLLPMVALAILVYTTLYPHMGNGPNWPNAIKWNEICRETWWSTLLFVQNYVHPQKLCLGHSWYLAVDMQLYLFAPFALIILWKWHRKGFAAVTIIGLLFVACLFTTIMINDYTYHVRGFFLPQGDTFKKTYFVTHARTSPWIVGILFGYYMHKSKGSRVQLSKLAVLIGWLLTFAIIGAIMFGLYPKALNRSDATTLEQAFYWSFGRLAWPIALCWMIFTCVNGYAGPINAFLSCPLWQPMARLSYSIYIWHLLLVEFNIGRVKVNTNFSSYDMTLQFWGDFGWSLLLSTYMHLAFEAPILNLEKVLLPKPNRAKPLTITVSDENLIPAKDGAVEETANNEAAEVKLVESQDTLASITDGPNMK